LLATCWPRLPIFYFHPISYALPGSLHVRVISSFVFSWDNNWIICVTRHLILRILDEIPNGWAKAYRKRVTAVRIVSRHSLYLTVVVGLNTCCLHVLVCNLQDNATVVCFSNLFIARWRYFQQRVAVWLSNRRGSFEWVGRPFDGLVPRLISSVSMAALPWFNRSCVMCCCEIWETSSPSLCTTDNHSRSKHQILVLPLGFGMLLLQPSALKPTIRESSISRSKAQSSMRVIFFKFLRSSGLGQAASAAPSKHR
jgi:hypothetical protein